jgi:hypothetical protein
MKDWIVRTSLERLAEEPRGLGSVPLVQRIPRFRRGQLLPRTEARAEDRDQEHEAGEQAEMGLATSHPSAEGKGYS